MSKTFIKSSVITLIFSLCIAIFSPGLALGADNTAIPENSESEFITDSQIEILENTPIDLLETVPLDTLEDHIIDDPYVEIEEIENYDDSDNNFSIFAQKHEYYPAGGIPGKVPTIKRINATTVQVKVYKTYNTTVFKNLVNGHLAGKYHPVTKIIFNYQGFPIFAGPKFKISAKYWKSNNTTIWNQIKGNVKDELKTNADFKKQFTQKEISDINKGIKPANFRIHHHQNTGEIQLVHKNLHEKTGHTGGKTIWGNYK